jgi:ATP-binding protein involved in chromosome partitioning
MIRKLNLNVLGIVENYTGEVFGRGAGEELAREIDAPFLGHMELRAAYRDSSKPTVLLDDDVAREYDAVAQAMQKSLKELGRQAV